MKKLLSMMLIFTLIISSVCAVDFTYAQAAGDELISYVSEQHPRLLINDFDTVREKIQNYPRVSEWYDAVKEGCDELLDAPVYSYNIERLEATLEGGSSRRIIATAAEILPRFFALSFTAVMENDTRYLNRLWAEIEAAVQLPTWNTAHWLEPAEMLQSFAIAYDWCYHMWTDEQLDIMREAMVSFALEPSLREYEGNPRWYQWHYGFEGDEMGTNWTAVCNTGVIMAAIALCDEEPALAEETLNYAIKSIKGCANEFIPDGGFREGIGYWAYAITNLILGAACLESGFEGFDGLPELDEPFSYNIMDYEGVGLAGDYASYLQGPVRAFNCGDASEIYAISSTLFYIANKMNRPDYAKHQLERMTDDVSLNALVQSIIWYDPEMEITVESTPLDKSFAVGVSTMRNTWSYGDNTVFVAMKGGENLQPHGHYDIGTFALEALGVRWVTMRGAGNYDWPQYGKRVNYYVGRPEGQNTIVINPDHTTGQLLDAGAELIGQKSGQNEAYVVYDLSAAYADYAEIVQRGIKMFDDRGRVLVQDEIIFTEPENEVWWFAHTAAEISVSEDGKEALLTQNGEKMFVRILEPSDAEFRIQEAAPMFESPNPAVQPGSYGTKLAICLEDAADSATIAVEFTPLPGDSAPPAAEASHKVIPLADWTTDADYARMEDVSIGVVAMLQGSSIAYAGSEKKEIDPDNPDIAPILKNDRTMVPLRFIAENIGGEVSWSDETREATIIYNHQQIVIKVGESSITVDGEAKAIDSPSIISGGRVYVPLRAISEAMGKHVYDENGLVLISDNENPYEEYPEYLEELRSLLKYNITVNGETALYFKPEKTDYRIFSKGNNSVTLKAAGETEAVEKSGDTIYMDIGGETYSFEFVPNEFEITEPYLTSIELLCTEEDEYIPESGHDATHIPVKSVTASADDGNVAANVVDSYIETRWSAQEEQFIQFDLGEEREITHMHAAFYAGASRSEIFDILTSVDGEEWITVFSGQADGTTKDMQLFELEPSTARYIKYQGYGNNLNVWNSVTEVRFYSSLEDAEADAEDWDELLVPSGLTYLAGDTYHLAIKGYLSNGDIISIEPSQAIWGVSDANVANISDDGELEIFETGSFAVYAQVNDGRIYRSNKFAVTAE